MWIADAELKVCSGWADYKKWRWRKFCVQKMFPRRYIGSSHLLESNILACTHQIHSYTAFQESLKRRTFGSFFVPCIWWQFSGELHVSLMRGGNRLKSNTESNEDITDDYDVMLKCSCNGSKCSKRDQYRFALLESHFGLICRRLQSFSGCLPKQPIAWYLMVSVKWIKTRMTYQMKIWTSLFLNVK